MSVSVERKGNEATLKFTIPVEEVAKGFERAVARVNKQVTIPGFRKGKAPRRVLEAHVGKDAIKLARTPELFIQLPVQKMALGLSKAFDLSPAAAVSIVWPNWARSNYQEHLQRFVDFAVNIMNVAPSSSDEETALKGIHAMEKFCRGFHFPATLEDAGIFLTDTEMSELIKSCLPHEKMNEKAAIYLILKNSQ